MQIQGNLKWHIAKRIAYAVLVFEVKLVSTLRIYWKDATLQEHN